MDDTLVPPRSQTACDIVSVLPRTGPKIPQALQQPVCDRSEWNHRRQPQKINTLRVGWEAWSTPGTQAIAIPVPPFTRVGMLICADAYTPEISKSLQNQEAQLLVSAASWVPGLHGPNGEWERCTLDTGLPLIVCNRTGPDKTLDFRQAESVVAKDGKRLLSLSSARSAVFTIEWDLEEQTLAKQDYQTLFL